jgi:hypothetical protein
MANTFEVISTTTVGASGTGSISFTSIPQTYTDIVLYYSLRSNNTSAGSGLFESVVTRINSSSTTSNYYAIILRGAGQGGTDSVTYQGNVSWFFPGHYVNAANNTANCFSNSQMYFSDYASSNSKTVALDSVFESNSATLSAQANYGAGLYSPTTAITSISLAPEYGTAWVQYSTATLYGIKNS